GVGEITQVNFSPRLRLLNTTGVQQDSGSGTVATEVTARATNSGTFTVIVDSVGTGTGTYRLSVAKTGSPVVISPGDEGGPMVNGTTHQGSIDTGDLDVWTFTANAGENIIVRMGEFTTTTLTPELRLYGPNGALLDSGSGQAATEVTARATNSGTFLVVVGDLGSGYVGTGNYRPTLAKNRSPVVISPGDEGGPLTNGATHLGTIETGDIDVWTFTASV